MINVVVDLSHHNDVSSWNDVVAAGIVGVIHKASEGVGYTDPMYAERRPHATGVGLLWGAYHFGTNGDGAAQADYFLQQAAPDEGTLLVLDFEENPSGGSMTIAQAEDFVSEVYRQTGRWPGLYAGGYFKGLLGNASNATLANCWLWWAEYGPAPYIPANWPTWTMWQYTDGVSGPQPHTVNGISDVDRDQFNGDIDGLERLWGAQAARPAVSTQPALPPASTQPAASTQTTQPSQTTQPAQTTPSTQPASTATAAPATSTQPTSAQTTSTAPATPPSHSHWPLHGGSGPRREHPIVDDVVEVVDAVEQLWDDVTSLGKKSGAQSSPPAG